jgi:hypothetical protein
MRHSPSISGHDTYLVLDDLGRFGRVWRETAEQDAITKRWSGTCWTINLAVQLGLHYAVEKRKRGLKMTSNV